MGSSKQVGGHPTASYRVDNGRSARQCGPGAFASGNGTSLQITTSPVTALQSTTAYCDRDAYATVHLRFSQHIHYTLRPETPACSFARPPALADGLCCFRFEATPPKLKATSASIRAGVSVRADYLNSRAQRAKRFLKEIDPLH
jgi:hypothetical protein